MSEKQNPSKERDLAYHEWCRRVCERCNWTLVGSTPGDGCSAFGSSGRTQDIPQMVLQELAAKDAEIERLRAVFATLLDKHPAPWHLAMSSGDCNELGYDDDSDIEDAEGRTVASVVDDETAWPLVKAVNEAALDADNAGEDQGEGMSPHDVMRETFAHIRRVGCLMLQVTEDLNRRAMEHDDSKTSPDEYEAFEAETPGLRTMTYGSSEYKAALSRLGPALKLHYERNRHHPEHHANGVHDMNLLDLIEMLADWKAATERHDDGDLARSIRSNADRFGYGDEIEGLLLRTAQAMSWCD